MRNGPVEEWQVEKIFTTDEMFVVLNRILALMTEAGFAEKEVFGVRLALEEAAVNAIKHGNKNDPKKSVHIRYSVTSDEAGIQIEDEGPGFDPNRVPDPLAAENLERPSGRGVFLMRHYMTWVEFNQRGNCVTMGKERNG